MSVLAALVVLAAGCQTPQRWISEEELVSRKDRELGAAQAEIQRIEASGERRMEMQYRSAKDSPGGASRRLDILVLSGGGAFGAFGAGFLDGWGSVAEPEFVRPHFDQVTGISTGALIAPYAFIGSPESYATLVDEYRNPGSNWVRRRGLIPFLPGNVSLFDVSGLHQHIQDAITPDLVSSLVEGGGEDRILLVGATNVDYGIFRVWDLARLARESPPEDAAREIATLLAASTAIPGAFPPVEIDDLLYVDGAAAMQIVGGLEDRHWLYAPDAQAIELNLDGPPIRIRVWVIINQKLRVDAQVVQSRWTSIASRSLGILLRTSTLQSIRDTETYLAFINQRPEFDAILRYVAIPQDFEIPDGDGVFDSETMRELVELGRQMGADPDSWRTEALRPGAPY